MCVENFKHTHKYGEHSLRSSHTNITQFQKQKPYTQSWFILPNPVIEVTPSNHKLALLSLRPILSFTERKVVSALHKWLHPTFGFNWKAEEDGCLPEEHSFSRQDVGK